MATETLYATSLLSGTITSSSNALGSGAGTWAGNLNTNSSWTTVWAMGDPTVSGAADGTQTVTVRARKGSNGNSPTIAINLYENGSLVGAIASATTVTSTTGQDVSGTWTGSSVTNENNVEIEVVMSAAGGSPSNRNSAQIDYIRWDGNFAAAPQVIGVGFATETDTAVGVSKIDPIQVALGTATETDAAVGVTLTVPTIVAVGAATETDSIPSGVVDNATESEMFETGADGDAIGTTYGIFDSGLDTNTGAWEVDTARAAAESKSGRLVLDTGDASYRRFLVSGGEQTIIQIRWYGYITSTDVVGTNIHMARALRTGGGVVARASIGSDQKFVLHDGSTASGTNEVFFDTENLFQKWIRYEWEIDTVADTQELQMFVDTNMHGTTPDYTINAPMTNTVGVGQIEVGSILTVGAPWDMNYDAIGYLAGATSPGPVTGSPALGVKKSKALGTATETDTAVGVTTGATTVVLGTATETDTAVGVAKIDTILVTLGTATETDSATGVAASKRRGVGTATETDTATGVAKAKRRAVVGATETDAASSLAKAKRVAVGTAAETDTAVGVSALSPQIIALGTATETDTAVGVAKIDAIQRTLGTATETDTAVGVTFIGQTIIALGTATETDTAVGVAKIDTILRALGTATETDSPTGLGKGKSRPVGVTTETDTATGVAKAKRRTLGTATETSTATGLGKAKVKTLGTATETDTATGVVLVGQSIIALGTATSSEAAVSLGKKKSLAVGAATESDAATGLTAVRTVALGTATETDTAVGVVAISPSIIALGTATETDTAVGLGVVDTILVALGTATETDAAAGVTLLTPQRIVVGVALELEVAGTLTRTYAVWQFTPPVRSRNLDPGPKPFNQTARTRWRLYKGSTDVPVSVLIVGDTVREVRNPVDPDPDLFFQGGRVYTITADDPRLAVLQESYSAPDLVRVSG